MSEPLDFGEYTPRKSIEGGSKSWPLSWAWQYNDARTYLRRMAQKSGASLKAGVRITVHWNRLPPTWLNMIERDGLEYVTETDPNTGFKVERSWDDIQTHVADLHAAFGIKPYDRPPGATRPE